jgi:2-polyprenyl-6-methoxyphenol hydroxylase-like FAD-dependent oxidoreductase
MKNQTRTVLISGASIAGPVLGYWLKKYGFTPTIVERAPCLRQGGQGVDIRGEAIEVIRQMGLWQQIKNCEIETYGISFLDQKLKSSGKISLRDLKNKNKSEEVEILRGDLSEILYGNTRNQIEYIFDDSITSIQETERNVYVSFKNSQPRTFDIVIGADGIHSNVRKLVFGKESDFIRFKNHYFAFAASRRGLGETGWVSLYNQPGTLAGYTDSLKSDDPQAYFMFHEKSLLEYDFHNLEQQKDILFRKFSGQNRFVDALLEDVRKDQHFYFDSISQIVMPSWSKGRVVLTGDAAYCASPVSGAGATLAIAGAYILAGELFAAEGDHIKAFRNYEMEFRPVVLKNQAGLFTSLLVPETSAGIWIRNFLSRIPFFGTVASIEKFMNFKKAGNLKLYGQS